jgi:hypothetical protein
MEALELEDTVTNYEQHDADGWCVMIFLQKNLCVRLSVCLEN